MSSITELLTNLLKSIDLPIKVHGIDKGNAVLGGALHEEQVAGELLVLKDLDQVANYDFVPLLLPEVLRPVVKHLHSLEVHLFVLLVPLPVLQKFEQAVLGLMNLVAFLEHREK